MAPFSPRIPDLLLAVILDLDDGRRPAAEIWRECGGIARRRGLHQPSYESVRRAVNAQRRPLRPRITRLRRLAIIAKTLLLRNRYRTGLVAGTHPDAG